MKTLTPLFGILLCHFFSYAQVGIGITSPNSKSILDLYSHSQGLLMPRMTYAEKIAMSLTANDAGMAVFQTDVPANPLPQTPKGMYVFDGTYWQAPLTNGSTNGQTMRWDGSKWAPTSNLFNSGSSIGIGTTSPKTQLHINSLSPPTTRLQFTNLSTLSTETDGLVLGITYANGDAHLLMQENKPLWFGTNSVERMRIDSFGNVGINKTNPSSPLDVNGKIKSTSLDVSGIVKASSLDLTGNIKAASVDVSGLVKATSVDVNGNVKATSLDANGPFKLGASGSQLTGIIRASAVIDIPLMLTSGEMICNVEIPNVVPTATVQISPSQALTDLMICYARVSANGNVEIKFKNTAVLSDPAPLMYYITVIQ